MDQKPQTARAQLAEAIAFTFKERQLNHHEVCRRCQVSVQDIGRWLDGSLVPAPQPWGQLRSRWSTFSQYQETWERARKEEQQEREFIKAGLTNGHRIVHPAPAVATNLGDKIREVHPPAMHGGAPHVRPPSAREDLGLPPTTERDRGGRVMLPPRPDGSNSAESRKLREDFARDMLRARPDARATGNDSVLTAVRRTFGVGITPATIEAIRREVRVERLHATPTVIVQPPIDPPGPPIQPPPPIASRVDQVNESDVAAGVEMIVSSIPGLRQLVIEVGDNGQASYTYEVRTVRTGRGTVRG